MLYKKPKCKKCGKEYDEDINWEENKCPFCCGKPFQCKECGEWAAKVNLKGLCENCIPRWKRFYSFEEMVDEANYSEGGELERIIGKIDAVIRVISDIVDCLPKEVKDSILTKKVERYTLTGDDDGVFIKEEDKIK